MRYLFVLFVLIPVLLLVAAMTSAQDGNAPPESPPLAIDVSQIPTPASVVDQMLTLIATFGVGVAVLAQPLISLYKAVTARWFPKAASYTGAVAFLTPLVLTLIYWAADYLGYGRQYEVVANNLITIIPVILTMFAGLFGTASAYQAMKKVNAPGLGAEKERFYRTARVTVPASAGVPVSGRTANPGLG